MKLTNTPDYTLLTPEEAAAVFKCSTKNVADMIKRGWFKTAQRGDDVYMLGFSISSCHNIKFALNQTDKSQHTSVSPKSFEPPIT